MRTCSIIFFFLFIVTSPLFAEICPSIKAIKSHQLNGWQAFDSEEKKILSNNRLKDFTRSVNEFALAQWEKTNAIECFYRDKFGSNLEIYLFKANFQPDNAKNYWYEVSGFKECAAGMERCQFKTAALHKKLARN